MFVSRKPEMRTMCEVGDVSLLLLLWRHLFGLRADPFVVLQSVLTVTSQNMSQGRRK